MSKYRRQDLPNTNALERTAKIGTVAIAAMLLACSGCQTLPQNAPVGTAASSFERDLSIARLAERHGDETKARKIYQSVLAHDSSNQEALHRMGVIAAREGRMTDALTYVESAMVSGAPNAELLGDLGYVYYQQKKYNLAEDKLNESLDLDPRNERSLNNLGLTLAAQKKYRQALSLFEQVSTPAEALANLAYAQSQLGDLNAAESNYHLALEADPKTKVAAVGLIELRKHMRLNRARSFRQPEAMIARSEPQPPVQPHSVAAIESIKNREPSWRTNPVAPAPSRSPIVESTTPPETTIVHSQNTLSTRKQPSFEHSRLCHHRHCNNRRRSIPLRAYPQKHTWKRREKGS